MKYSDEKVINYAYILCKIYRIPVYDRDEIVNEIILGVYTDRKLKNDER